MRAGRKEANCIGLPKGGEGEGSPRPWRIHKQQTLVVEREKTSYEPNRDQQDTKKNGPLREIAAEGPSKKEGKKNVGDPPKRDHGGPWKLQEECRT